jgi:catalase
MPPRRQPDQTAPKPTSPTGNTNGEAADFNPRAQSGKFLTTAQGLRLPDTDHSLKAGDRGPSLLEDFLRLAGPDQDRAGRNGAGTACRKADPQ